MPSTPSSAAPEPAHRRLVALVLLVALLGLGLVGVVAALRAGSSDPTATRDRSQGSAGVGETAPPFELVSLSGKQVSLAGLRGRPVIVNFWASWCVPCRKEFPLLKRAAATYARDRLAILGVIFKDLPADARRFARQQGADWPLLVDPEGAVAARYRVRSAPTTLFVDRNGTVVERYLSGFNADQLSKAIAEIT